MPAKKPKISGLKSMSVYGVVDGKNHLQLRLFLVHNTIVYCCELRKGDQLLIVVHFKGGKDGRAVC